MVRLCDMFVLISMDILPMITTFTSIPTIFNKFYLIYEYQEV